MSVELKEAVERLKACADDDEAHWSLDPREGWAVDVPVSDLRTILAAIPELERLREALWPFARVKPTSAKGYVNICALNVDVIAARAALSPSDQSDRTSGEER